jgi:hypothetical protein
MDIIYYILLFDRRFIMRQSKLIIINPLVLTNYAILNNKPRIVPNIFDEIVYGYIVHFHNPAFKMKYNKLPVDGEYEHRYIFEKNVENRSGWNVFYCK